MEFEERLAKTILLAQKFREESFDRAKMIRTREKGKFPNPEKCYKLSIHEASNKATEQLGFDARMTLPIYLLNKYCWNDIQAWAERNNK